MLQPNSAIICVDLDEFNEIEMQIHQGIIDEYGADVEKCWAKPITRKVFWRTEYAVPVEDRVLKYLTDKQIDRIETLDESWFPEQEED